MVSVTVSTQNRGEVVVLVEDSGAGVAADLLPHIFERFRRGDVSRSRTTGGFGLGLSICKAIIEAYDGHIQIENLNGAGTRVSVSLPAILKDAVSK
jgi:signal transduction histidine kinase